MLNQRFPSASGHFEEIFHSLFTADGEPVDLDEAHGTNEWTKWLEAHYKEWSDLAEHKAIEWAHPWPPDDAEIIHSCEVFKRKLGKDNQLTKYQVRVVAKGFQQTMNISFAETFSPTAQPVSVRLLVAISVANDYVMETADVNTAYLNADLETPVWMRPPKGVKDPEGKGRIIKLHKSLYGLKVSAKNWHRTFVKKIKAFTDTSVDIQFNVVTSD